MSTTDKNTTEQTIAQRLQPNAEGKSIIWDRQMNDFACFLDGQFLGYESDYSRAETKISAVYYEQLTHTQVETADIEAEMIEHEAQECAVCGYNPDYPSSLPTCEVHTMGPLGCYRAWGIVSEEPDHESIPVASFLDSLATVADDARADVTDTRWLNAINKAYSWLLEQEHVTFAIERHELALTSPSGQSYTANGSCQCKAFTNEIPCWHRAAARLVRRAIERESGSFAVARDAASELAHDDTQQQRLLSHKAAQARVVARAIDLVESISLNSGKLDVSLARLEALKKAVEGL